jgi:hypothetical protein
MPAHRHHPVAILSTTLFLSLAFAGDPALASCDHAHGGAAAGGSTTAGAPATGAAAAATSPGTTTSDAADVGGQGRGRGCGQSCGQGQGRGCGQGCGQGCGRGAGRGGHGRGMGHGPAGGPGHDPQHAADRDVFHFLLDHRDAVRRTVTLRPDGVETVTESDDPAVAGQIREHVKAMYARVQEGRPIHQRDPLFRALFAHAESLRMQVVDTDRGVRVVETSSDPWLAKLIQAHAQVIDRFLANGRAEVHRDHAVPERPVPPPAAAPAEPGS